MAVVLGAGLSLGQIGMAQAADHNFVGVAKCKTCHKSEKKGNQIGQWSESRHAKAYETLATDKAKEVGKKLGIEDPQKSDKCLKCHVTGHGAEAALFEESFKKEDGVQCESCHGAGKDYKKLKTMKSREDSVAAGMIIPDEKTCTGCHNKESPSFKGFCYAHYLAKVLHDSPNVKNTEKTITCTCDKKEDLQICADGTHKLVKSAGGEDKAKEGKPEVKEAK